MVYMGYAKIGKESDMLLMIILILLVGLMVGSIESSLREAFSNPDWLTLEDESICDYRQRLEMENTEFNYGHNVNHKEKNNE